MHTDPDYSAAYVVLRTDADDGVEGHGLTFTSGRGTEVCVAAAHALEPFVVGRTLDGIVGDMSGFWRSLVSDSQLRWIGPEKGAIHLATAAVVNAVWDLWAKIEGKPLWKLLVDLTPEEIVGCIDFRYITDALAPEEALELLRDARRGSVAREAEIAAAGYPAYTTSAGWLGLRRRQGRVARSGGRRVGLHSREDEGRQRPRLRRPSGRSDPPRARARGNPDDGRQPGVGRRRGDRGDADARRARPWWIEEPTSPDDILGHARIRREIAPVRVATGEHIQNRVVFKQLFQAEAIDVCQLDACRVGGVNEAISIQLLAAKFGIPVCPHAGGVGCASTSSISPSSTTSPSAARSRTASSSGSTICTSTSAILPSCATAGTWRRPPPATASRCCPSRSTSTRSRRAGVGRRRPLGGRGLMHTVTEPKQIEAGARTSRDRYGSLGRREERRHRNRARHEGQRGELR